ncbi:MAG: phosphatidate cytidylyltransferase [Candidatus Accumulibacter sp.]|jgi:phosphatidate cytidylyltransferase|nr:phosphatidate cytidylyltransferase [Accumulibacter sp.]
MLRARILTALALLAGLAGALFFLPDPGWIALCALAAAAGAWEWGGLAGWGRPARVAYAAALGALCVAVSGASSPGVINAANVTLVRLGAAFWLIAAPFWLRYKWPLRGALAALVGVLVLAPAALVFMWLRWQYGPWGLLMAVAPVWAADIAAYFAGRAFGRKKLAPSISPGKTWAGAAGAALGVMVYGIVISATVKPTPFAGPIVASEGISLPGLVMIAVCGLFVTALAIEGDLFESLLKRRAGVKDSGALLPGHGGILDRIDSLTAVLPVLPLLPFVQTWVYMLLIVAVRP